jgi:dienelactone hydrolase
MHGEPNLPETGTQQMTLTAAGTILGTAAYMSPEQAAGKDADARSDIFSFGIVLYEMLCGRRPFTGSSTTEVMSAILKTECAPPRQLRPDIPAPVERIVLKCLQRDPKSRYASGTELEQDLAAAVSSSETGRFLSLRAALAIAALLIAVAGGYYGWQSYRSYRREADLRWLEETAVPEIEKLLTQNRALEAQRLYREAERIAPDSKLLYKLAEGVASHPVSFETAPAGATIYVSDYTAAAGDDLSNWQRLGEAPVTTSVPEWGYYRVRAVKEGYAAADQVFAEAGAVTLTLHPSGTVPEGMVWVPPTSSTQVQPSIALPGFWIDRYEVTNRQFQSFVKAGGYEKPEYWNEPFVKDGRPLSWKQAMLEFRDLTGRPGPASWILGTSRDGEADLPAAGVSWYEAMAYCEYAGKALPTFHEWRRAAPVEFNADVVLMSNFSGKGPSPADTYRGMTAFGSYDMAGNVKEWTVNTDGTRRYALGGAWNEASYVFSIADALDSFSRTIDLGFRCVKRLTPAPAESLAQLQLRPREVRSEKPVDDVTYRIFAGYHQYEPSELDPREEHVDSLSPYYTRERITFRAAYDDRVIAHLFLPKNTMPPHHVVIVFGGSGIMSAKRVEDFGFPYEFLILSGRAVMIPAYAGTLERGPSDLRLPPQEERDRSLKWSWDLSRSVDYLQARAKARGDVDATKLGFYGISWGASHAARLLAVEKRFRAAVWLSGGLLTEQPREVDSWNFARHYTVPTLMINGKQDFTIPLKTNVEMLFNALGTPIAHKKLYLTEGGHRNPVTQPEVLGETIKWFDRYLGPVEER